MTQTEARKKIVLQYDMGNSLMAIHESMNDAAEACGGHQANISKACLGKIKTAYGFKWKFKDKK